MQMKRSKKLMSLILCMALVVAMALFTNGCNGNVGKDTSSGTETDVQSDKGAQAGDDARSDKAGQSGKDDQADDAQTEVKQLGEGGTKFMFTVVDKEGVVAGDDGEYGLYVNTVNGITVDYDTDGVYWAFYVNDEYAMTGVDATTITEGDTYSFKVE